MLLHPVYASASIKRERNGSLPEPGITMLEAC